MSPSFAIVVDIAASIVRVQMSGFFREADIMRFAVERESAHRRLRCGPHRHRTLVDIREMRIQSQDSVDAFGALLSNRAFTSARIAFVVNVGLAHAQLRRAAMGRDARYFTSKEEAETWLSDISLAPSHRNVPKWNKRTQSIARGTQVELAATRGQAAGSSLAAAQLQRILVDQAAKIAASNTGDDANTTGYRATARA